MESRRNFGNVQKYSGNNALFPEWHYSMRGFLEGEPQFIALLDKIEA